jgi:tRNA G10  N-methylase Trm11
MRYLFILGRNPELSVLEIKSFLKRTGNSLLNEERKEGALVLELESPLDAGTVEILGGTIAIGIVFCELKEMDKKEVYMGESNKFNYIIWNFSDKTEEISNYLKKRFRKEKLKAVEKKLTGRMSLQEGGKAEILSSNLIDEEYFVFENYFGKIIQRIDPKKIEERDINKPVRRESLSISPRLAKIMINLSEIKEDEKLVDAFCGIGVILIEALNQNLPVIGIDKDNEAIKSAKMNLEWFEFPKKNYQLIGNDSSKVRIAPADVLVSEPDFGEILKKTPGEKEARIMIEKFENLMISVLNNMKKFVKGKFVFTAPLIQIDKNRKGCSFEKISKATGLKIVSGFPVKEFREGQIVGREIAVMVHSR